MTADILTEVEKLRDETARATKEAEDLLIKLAEKLGEINHLAGRGNTLILNNSLDVPRLITGQIAIIADPIYRTLQGINTMFASRLLGHGEIMSNLDGRFSDAMRKVDNG